MSNPRFDWRLSEGKHAWRLLAADGQNVVAVACRQLGGPTVGPSTWGAIINACEGFPGNASPTFNNVEEAVNWVELEVQNSSVLLQLISVTTRTDP